MMTENEWFTSTDSYTMLNQLATGDPRKLRQLACAWALHWLREHANTKHISVVEVYQRYIDGEASPTEWFETYSGAGGATLGSPIQDLIAPAPWEAARRMAGFSHAPIPTVYGRRRVVGPVDRPEEARLLRDIFGNPFRPVVFSPNWRTGTTMSLAHQIRESREFSAMPILADALQDAGCDNGDVLDHCRDTTLTHARGCWVVDQVLNKR